MQEPGIQIPVTSGKLSWPLWGLEIIPISAKHLFVIKSVIFHYQLFWLGPKSYNDHLEMAPLVLIWRPVLHHLNLEGTCLCPPIYQGSARGQTTYLYSTSLERNRTGKRCAPVFSLLLLQSTAKSLGLAQNQGCSKSLNKYVLPDCIIKHQFCKWRKDFLHQVPFYHDSSIVK